MSNSNQDCKWLSAIFYSEVVLGFCHSVFLSRIAFRAIGGVITANSKAAARLLAGENTQQGQRLRLIYKIQNRHSLYIINASYFLSLLFISNSFKVGIQFVPLAFLRFKADSFVAVAKVAVAAGFGEYFQGLELPVIPL